MFTGIVESVQKIEKVVQGQSSISLWISRPQDFNDLKIGDSIAVNGICLTLEDVNKAEMKFTLGAETLKIISDSSLSGVAVSNQFNLGNLVNLERSLKWGDRIHGHLVSGHVEALGAVTKSEPLGDSWILEIKCPAQVVAFVLNKGSIALHGVSLTVNQLENSTVQVCLIPETLRKTNLKQLSPGDEINIETDLSLKSLLKTLENKELIKKISEQIQNNCKVQFNDKDLA